MNPVSFLQLAAEAEALRLAWAERNARREKGARAALAGYTYQFLVVLLWTVEHWLESPPERRADRRVFNELLSDALEVTGEGLLCVTQIKLRQSSTLLRRALEELWSIYEVAAEERPNLLERLSFRILAAESGLDDIGAAIARWCAEKAVDAGRSVEPFRARLTVGRETHPEDRLFALLANASDLRAPSPQSYIDRWLGQITAAAGAVTQVAALRQAEQRILEDLVTLYNSRSDEHPRIYVWTDGDRPPTTVSPGRFLAGRQPQVADLRDGCFAHLPTRYERFHHSARSWVEKVTSGSTDRYKLPLLWLQGRSGSGKSVALLHLLAGLHGDGQTPIFWLGPRLSLLPHAMRLAVQASRQGKTPIIGLDDPYTPGLQDSARRDWQESFAELQAFRDAAEEFSGPVLVICCGPTEQASQFLADFADDVEVWREEVPHEQDREFAALRRWYKERTGHEPPDVGDDGVLLVQLFFEWRRGEPLLEFAARFRRRIEKVAPSDALFDRLARVFALNRLYVGYPPGAVPHGLSPTEEGLLRQLESDEHFGVDASGERSGFWWLHPHLANSIYEAWFQPEPRNTPARREHLRAGIDDSLAHGERPSEKAAPLWAIARALAVGADADLSRRLQATDIPRVLTTCYRQVVSTNAEELPLALAPVWIDLHFILPDLAIGPDPVQEGIRQVRVESLGQNGLRLTCHKLLQHLGEMPERQRNEALDAVFGLLRAAPSWYEWLPVVWDAVPRVRDSRLWALVAGWVEEHLRHPSAPRLLERSLRSAPTDLHLIAAAQRLLPGARPDFAWGDVAMQLLESSSGSSSPAPVLAWVRENSHERGVCYILGALLRRHLDAAVAWAHEWLPLWHREPSANYVLEPLLAITGTSDRFLEWCLAWLDLGRGDPSYLMQRLVEAAPGDMRVLSRMRKWLEKADANHGGWTFVWRELRKAFPDDAEILAAGRAWLVAAGPHHGGWGFVWPELQEALPGDKAILAAGRSWLTTADPSHRSWAFVWKKLRKVLPDDAGILAAGRAWLATTDPSHRSWTFVWQELQRVHPDDAEILAAGRAWIATADSSDASFGFVWTELWKAFPEDAEILAAGRSWLLTVDPSRVGSVWPDVRKALPDDEEILARGRSWLAMADPNHPSWGFVWPELRKALPGDAEILAAGRSWLATVDPSHRSWVFVWQELREELPEDAEILAAGRAWLATAGPSQASLGVIWPEIWKAFPGDAKILAAGRAWLLTVDPSHAGWGSVWPDVRKALPDDVEILARGRSWLAMADPNHPSWGFVWPELHRALPDDAEILARGRSWLAMADPNHPSWGFVWPRLRKALPGDAEILAAGRSWLATVDPRHRSWIFVWQILGEEFPGDAELLAAGRAWLATADPSHASWGFVWPELRRGLPEDAKILSAGRGWLRTADPREKSWRFVWRELRKALPDDEEILNMGSAWLAQVDLADRAWAYVWQDLWSKCPGDLVLVEMGRRWLAQQNDDAGWPSIWEQLRSVLPEDESLKGLALHWLGDGKTTRKQWLSVWNTLRACDPTAPDLVEGGRRWLREAPRDHPEREQFEAALLVTQKDFNAVQ